MATPKFAAVLADPFKIIGGLFLFVISLFGIPIFFNKLQDIVIELCYFTVYIVTQFRSFIFPSDKFLEQAEREIEESPEIAQEMPPEIANEAVIDKVLNLLDMIIFEPNALWKLIKNDLNLSNPDTGFLIRFKYKTPFFILATIGSFAVCFFPEVFKPYGLGMLKSLLESWDIKPAIASYAAIIVVGGLIYSMRTFAVALIVGVKNLSSPAQYVQQHQPPSSTRSFYLKLDLLSDGDIGDVKEQEDKVLSVNCDNCNHKIYFRPALESQEQKPPNVGDSAADQHSNLTL